MKMNNWKEYKLSELFEFKNGVNADKEAYGQGTKFINISEVLKNNSLSAEKIPGQVSLSREKIELYRVRRGDVLFNRTSEVPEEIAMASVFLDDAEVVFGGFVIRGRNTTDLIDENFSKYLFCCQKFRKQAISKAQGAVRANIGQENLGKIVIDLPPIKEQKKIAEILSVWDRDIEKRRKLIDLKYKYKKWIINQLFIKEVRKEWMEVDLATVVDSSDRYSFTGGPFGSDLKASDYTETGVRIIQLQNIGDGCFNNDYKIFTSETKADQLKSCNIFPGEIIISKMGDPVARATLIPSFHPRYVMASDGIRVKVDKKRFSNTFILEAINSSYFRGKARSVSTGTTRMRIGLSELKKIKFSVPKDIKVQEKYSKLFDLLNEEISILEKKVHSIEDQRSALLQQLLSGQKRIKV